ncbi:MAG: AroM family protein [Desulfurococcaceae archaeon]
MKKVGFITIGQSPRADIVTEIKDILGSNVEIAECGALDKLTIEEINALAPGDKEDLLVTRLRDGKEVKVSANRIIPFIQSCIKTLEREVEAIGLLCTGEFPNLSSAKPLIEPSLLLINIVKSIGLTKLGVFVPDPAQIRKMHKKWESVASDIQVMSVSPYTGGEGCIREVAMKMRDRDLIVLDCMGYNKRSKKIVSEITGKPVILPRTLLASVIRELVET